MIKYLRLSNVGPAPQMEMEPAPRLNLITGDNGLGKSFLLDIAWWAMTRHWPAETNSALTTGLMARPRAGSRQASIAFSFTRKVKSEQYESKFNSLVQSWTGRPGRPPNPGLVLYALADGSFAVWDPARNFWRKRGNIDIQDRPNAYVFSAKEIWGGLRAIDGGSLCNGLIVDWASWQKEDGQPFQLLKVVLSKLSPPDGTPLSPGRLTRVGLDDVRDIPTIVMPYGEVPILHASAGIKRIVALAYLLVWAWQEHLQASRLLGTKKTRQIVFLIDEIEAHLHPRWQRVVVGALLTLMETLARNAQVQLIAATHSPLVLASVETYFDAKRDAWFDLNLKPDKSGGKVELNSMRWTKYGDVSNWLTSDAFDLKSPRSIEAEHVMERAALALSNPSFGKSEAIKLHSELGNVLSDTDLFWIRWRYIAQKRGWLV